VASKNQIASSVSLKTSLSQFGYWGKLKVVGPVRLYTVVLASPVSTFNEHIYVSANAAGVSIKLKETAFA
tara:strand:- start:199 stop:408 length:210 start_codon:yes stop_codon:yes gene_type:complete